MPSPFPGMNPYLEQVDVWQDFHQTFLPLIREVLSEQVRPAYLVKIEDHLVIHDFGLEERFLGRSDVSFAKADPKQTSRSAGALLEAPTYGRVPVMADIEHQSYVEIRDRANRELITILELLSPSNKKRGLDRDRYLAKRQQLMFSSVHFIEIDLLRGGPRLPLEGLQPCDYYALVSRAEDRPTAGIWPLRLKDQLPDLPVPLRNPDADARIDLQQLLHRAYDAAGYEDYIYTGLPQPPLSPEEEDWAKVIISGENGKK